MTHDHERAAAQIGFGIASLTYVRVVHPDGRSIDVSVPPIETDMLNGATAQFRMFRAAAGARPNFDYQIAPQNVVLPPLVPDKSGPDDPLKHSYIGEIIIRTPTGEIVYTVSKGPDDNVPIDMTAGADIKLTWGSGMNSLPIGPMFNVVIAPAQPLLTIVEDD